MVLLNMWLAYHITNWQSGFPNPLELLWVTGMSIMFPTVGHTPPFCRFTHPFWHPSTLAHPKSVTVTQGTKFGDSGWNLTDWFIHPRKAPVTQCRCHNCHTFSDQREEWELRFEALVGVFSRHESWHRWWSPGFGYLLLTASLFMPSSSWTHKILSGLRSLWTTRWPRHLTNRACAKSQPGQLRGRWQGPDCVDRQRLPWFDAGLLPSSLLEECTDVESSAVTPINHPTCCFRIACATLMEMELYKLTAGSRDLPGSVKWHFPDVVQQVATSLGRWEAALQGSFRCSNY